MNNRADLARAIMACDSLSWLLTNADKMLSDTITNKEIITLAQKKARQILKYTILLNNEENLTK
tara:strand:+ start:212 stop:403 length:192 start_codon:yes stop_codon:yes gene_type:complete